MDVEEGNSDSGSHVTEGHYERLRVEPIYEAFRCPLTKEVMQDPVTLENGQTFERAAIEKWFKECRDNGREPTCPLTYMELNTTDMSPSIALRNTIEEWKLRNDTSLLEMVHKSLSLESSENDILIDLKNIREMCHKSRSHKRMVRNADIIPLVAGNLKNISREVRCKALETLRIVAEDDDDNKEAVAVGDTIRTVVKFLSHNQPRERGEAVSLLLELSKCPSVCEKIGEVPGAILILLGMSSSNSENVSTVQKAEDTLEILENCEKNVLQMAENGRLQPLLKLLLEGSPETQLTMATFLGNLVVSNDVKVLVAETAGKSLVDIMRNGSVQAREASLKALHQISSNEVSARLVIEQGILPPLVKDLFGVGNNQLPMRLKEISAGILANIVACNTNFKTIPVGHKNQTLVSEDVICNLLHLISNTGPTIACKLLQVLVGLTSSTESIQSIVSAIKSSGATISLVQFIEAPQRDLRMASIKLLRNVSPHMGRELADALCSTSSLVGSLLNVIKEDGGISEEHVAAIELLADLPEMDLALTQYLLKEGVFHAVIQKLQRVRQGRSRVGRYVNPFLEGLVKVVSKVTYNLDEEPAIQFSIETNLTALFTDLLQTNGLDNVQMVSAIALENLSQKSMLLRNMPQEPEPCCMIFPCFSRKPSITGLCRVHHGFCSARESFCLLHARAIERLVSCLDHNNEKVVESSMAALCTLLGDDVDTLQGVQVLVEAGGLSPVLQLLVEKRTERLRALSVYAVERMLRVESIGIEINGDPLIGTALVDAFQRGDNKTKQIAEHALKMIDRLPNFSGIFPKPRMH